MKIQDILSLPINPAAKPEAKPTGEANFAQILQKALGGNQKTQSTQAPMGLELLSALNPVAGTDQANNQKMVEDVLSTLENYSQGLGQTDLSLKSLSPMVESLEQHSQQLQAAAQKLPANSPLKKVMQEAAALAYTESVKFNRGDYV